MKAGEVPFKQELIFNDNATDEISTPFSELNQFLESNSSIVKGMQSSPPDNVSIIGSYLLRSVAKPHQHVDVAVTIPSELIDSDLDVRDHRYYVKRAAYLCYIAQHLKSYPMFESLEIVPFRNDMFKPIIVITPKADEKLAPKFTRTRFQIRIFPVIDNDTFDLASLDPIQVNLKTETHQAPRTEKSKRKKQKSEPVDDNQQDLLSSRHNHGILEDMFMFDHLQFLHTHLRDSPSLVETCTLLKVWARQRVMYFTHDGLNGFLLSMLMVHLLVDGKINRHMSPVQILKIFMTWITTTDLTNIVINTGDLENEETILANMQKAFPIVVLDRIRHFNLFHRVSVSAWKQIQHEASLTLFYLDENRKIDAIKALFLEKHTYWNKYDLHLNVSDISTIPFPSRYNHDSNWNLFVSNEITKLLSKAFGDRCKYVRVIRNDQDSLLLGLVLNKEWDSLMIVGPSAGDVPARQAFETFWGEQAKMQQFKDGTLKMVVEWDIGDQPSVMILERIAKHVLSYHMKAEHVQLIGKHLHSKPNKTNDQLQDTFQTLRELLSTTAPENLNLDIRSVSVASPHYYGLGHPTDIVNTVVEFYENSRWPDEAQAIHQLKKLVYIRWSQVLSNKGKRISAIPHEHWLDITINGILFRVVIRLMKELYIYKTSGMALDPRVTNTEKQLIQIPMHYQAMDLFRSQYPAFTQTVQLAKNWIHAHLFSDHVDERLIEVLCAHAFVYHYPYESPKTPSCAFVRFVHLLASHTWHENPLFVDLTVDQDGDDEQEQETKKSITARDAKKKKREQLDDQIRQIRRDYEVKTDKPNMSVVVSYNGIDLNSFWTNKESPSRVIMNRLIQLAKHADFQLGQLYQTVSTSDWNGTLFTTSMKGFDVLLRLKPAHSIQNKKYKFDPVSMYIKDLTERFGDKLLLFRNATKNDVIALVWNPSYFMPRGFRLDKAAGTVMATNKSSMLLNTFEILDDIVMLGEGLIQSVQFLQQAEVSRLPSLRAMPPSLPTEEKVEVKKQQVKKVTPKKTENKKRKRT
jgi:U3 small nucleolar RNA-associated protein 22